ncbi:hypothetical protein [Spirosoma sp. KUDC1026]|uniref:hypothetical protein n=1 Tax=Spirosoma sp. KUDC1026 TaxID=2745947 RepID=UPI00159BBF7B|nr:hypothetical protein [Spirosoma sp. KUDC1026]QKZ15000.1 hypothetical protein HU175_21190 [Spirosoma sp. KUDC1026]
MLSSLSADSMNSALLTLYTEYLPEINKLIKSCKWESGVSKPFFMHVSDEYIHAPHKILFVGRETYGWEDFNESDSPIPSIELYKNVYESNKHYNSPFWWFREGLSQEFGIDKSEFMKATLWTNISKVDVGKRRPTGKEFDQLVQLFINLLINEIAIVKPDLVLIMTKDGFYNWHLNYYNWQKNKPYEESDHEVKLERSSTESTKLDRLITNNLLPVHSYQMCHPRALCRKGGYRPRANELISIIRKQADFQQESLI